MSQPGDSEAILQLARELGAAGTAAGDEIKLRCAVGRAYYAAFLLARDRLRIVDNPDEGGVHGRVIGALKRRSMMLANNLEALRAYRTSADYSFPATDPAHLDWQENWKQAENKSAFVVDRLKQLPR
jgi:hypothetical protein